MTWYQIITIVEKHNVLFSWTCENWRKVDSHGGWDHNFESSKVGLVLAPTAMEKGISYSLQSSDFLSLNTSFYFWFIKVVITLYECGFLK